MFHVMKNTQSDFFTANILNTGGKIPKIVQILSVALPHAPHLRDNKFSFLRALL